MNPRQARQLLAREAARILAEEGRRDYLTAKRKAAERLGLPARHLPTNREVAEALLLHQRLFEAPQQPARLERLRRTALAAIDAFDGIEARAAGAVTGEVATAHAVVEIHVFADAPEALAFRLCDLGLRYREGDRRLRWSDGRTRSVPVFGFVLGGVDVEALAFGPADLREAPVDPVDGRPMRRLGRRALEAMLACPAPGSAGAA